MKYNSRHLARKIKQLEKQRSKGVVIKLIHLDGSITPLLLMLDDDKSKGLLK